MSAKRYRVTLGSVPVYYARGTWQAGHGADPKKYLLTSGQAARVKRAAEVVGILSRTAIVVNTKAAPASRKRPATGKATKAARRARMLRNLAKGRATRKANLKKRNR